MKALAHAPPAQPDGQLGPAAADETGTTVERRAHAAVCVALWILHVSDTASRDAYGCSLTPDALPASDQPCRIRVPYTIVNDVTYDERGRLAHIRRVDSREETYRFVYDAATLASIEMPPPYRLRRRYEGSNVEHDEIGGLTHRTRYTLVSGRVVKTEHFILETGEDPRREKESYFTSSFIWRGERVVSREAPFPSAESPRRVWHTRWDARGRPLRVEVEADTAGPRVIRADHNVQYDTSGLPIHIDDAEIEYQCGSRAAPGR